MNGKKITKTIFLINGEQQKVDEFYKKTFFKTCQYYIYIFLISLCFSFKSVDVPLQESFNSCSTPNIALKHGEEISHEVFYHWNFIWMGAGESKATIKEKNDKGAVVTFADGVEGFAPSRFLTKEDGSKLGQGDTAEFIVLEFSKEYRRVVISHTSIFKTQERKNIKAAATKSAEAEKTTLGDIGGLADLKKKMEQGK